MNTRYLLVASSVFLASAGAATTFAPEELLHALAAPATDPLPVLIQLLGALYFAFAMVDWMARDTVMGGIYGRPLGLGNFVHFVVGALALAKGQWAQGVSGPLLGVLAVYTLFAIGFGYVLFAHDAVTPPNALKG